jgi:hypothetical protein
MQVPDWVWNEDASRLIGDHPGCHLLSCEQDASLNGENLHGLGLGFLCDAIQATPCIQCAPLITAVHSRLLPPSALRAGVGKQNKAVDDAHDGDSMWQVLCSLGMVLHDVHEHHLLKAKSVSKVLPDV